MRGGGVELISGLSYVLRYHRRHLGTGGEEGGKKEKTGKHNTHNIGKEAPKQPNELDLLSEICQTLYHSRGILSGNCNTVELQTLRLRRSLSNKQLLYATTACLSFILIYLPVPPSSPAPRQESVTFGEANPTFFTCNKCAIPSPPLPLFPPPLPVLKFKAADFFPFFSGAASSLAGMNSGPGSF